jgi:hypothetical protein
MAETVMGNMLALDNEIDVDVYARGEDGRGIVSATIQYATNSSASEHPTSGWGDTIPVVTQGNYLWEKITYTYIDDTTFESYLSIYIAQDGVSITSVDAKYQEGESGTTAPSGYWSPTIVAAAPGKYLWTKLTINYSNNTSEDKLFCSYMGENGAVFTPAVSAEGIISWTNDKGLPNPTARNIKGPKGDQGDPGVSPVANISKTGSVATITITDASGTTTATVSDGAGDMSKSEFVYECGTGQVLNSKSIDGVELDDTATTGVIWTCDKIKTNTSSQIADEGVTTLCGTTVPSSDLGKNGDIYILID